MFNFNGLHFIFLALRLHSIEMGKAMGSEPTILGHSIEEWTSFTETQKETEIQTNLEGLSETERADKIKEIEESFDSATTYLKDLEDGLEDQQRADLSQEMALTNAEYLDTIQEMLTSLETDDELVATVNSDLAKYNKDIDGDTQLSSATVTLDGGTYTYNVQGGAANPFSSEISDEEYLEQEGFTVDGVVAQDVNLDGVKNQADLDEALKQRTTDTLSLTNFFMSPDPDWHYSLVKSDPTTGNYTFKVEDADGNYAYQEFVGAQNVAWFFTCGITEADLKTMADTWPPELLQMCYWGDEDTSFAQYLVNMGYLEESALDGSGTSVDNPFTTGTDSTATETTSTTTDTTTTATSSRTELTILPGFNETYAAFDGLHTEYGFDAEELMSLSKDEFALAYQNAIETFFTHLDDPTQSPTDLFDGLLASWQSQGLTEADIANLIHYITLGIATQSKENMPTLLGPVVSQMEGLMMYEGEAPHENGTQMDKFISTLLETMAGPGDYGDGTSTGMFTLGLTYPPDGKHAGEKWKDMDENLWAALQTQNFYKDNGVSVPKELTDVIGFCEELGGTASIGGTSESEKTEESADAAAGSLEISDETYTTLLANASAYGSRFGDSFIFATDGVTQDSLTADLKSLISAMQSADLQTEKDMTNLIVNTITGMKAAHQDDCAAAFSMMLKELAPDIWKQLIGYSTFKSSMWGIIDNNNDEPDEWGDLKDMYGK